MARLAASLLASCLAAAPASASEFLSGLLLRYAADAPFGPRELPRLEEELFVLAQGIESFRHPSHFEALRRDVVPLMDAEVRPFFSSRETALDALYRSLAVVDHSWALRGEPSCEAASHRLRLLRSDDGLFLDPKTGRFSPWLVRALGRDGVGAEQAEALLDQASLSRLDSPAAYERARARMMELTARLKDSPSSALRCERALLFEALAAYQREPRELPRVLSDAAVVRIGERAGTVVEGLVVAAGRWARDEPVELELKDGSRLAGRVLRADAEKGLALITAEGLPSGLLIKEGPEPEGVVHAIGHLRETGYWSQSAGLITGQGRDWLRTDAGLPGQEGGPVLSPEGALLGVLLDRPEPGYAIKASALKRWIDSPDAALDLELDAPEGRSGVLLSAALPREAPAELIEASVSGRCVAYCGGPPPPRSYAAPPSSYGSVTNSPGYQMGQAMGEAFGRLIGKGIASLFAPRPRRAAPHARAAPPVERRVERPAPPPKPASPPPPRITGLALSLNPSTAGPEDSVTITARVSVAEQALTLAARGGAAAPLAGLSVRIEIPGRQALTLRTDDSGRASAAASFKKEAAALKPGTEGGITISAQASGAGKVVGGASAQARLVLRSPPTPEQLVRSRADDAFGGLKREEQAHANPCPAGYVLARSDDPMSGAPGHGATADAREVAEHERCAPYWTALEACGKDSLCRESVKTDPSFGDCRFGTPPIHHPGRGGMASLRPHRPPLPGNCVPNPLRPRSEGWGSFARDTGEEEPAQSEAVGLRPQRLGEIVPDFQPRISDARWRYILFGDDAGGGGHRPGLGRLLRIPPMCLGTLRYE